MAARKQDKTLDSASEYNVGWIAALPHERAAALAMLDERHNKPRDFTKKEGDPNSYTWGRIGDHNVVIASLGGVYGTVSTAITAHSLRLSLPHIRLGLFVGIGAGVPQTDQTRPAILLGDIVVSDPDGTIAGVVQYDLIKSKATKELKGALNSPPAALLSAVAAIKAEHEFSVPEFESFLQAIRDNPQMREPYAFPGIAGDRLRDSTGNTRESPKIHYGTIASGDTLLKNAAERDALVAWLRENKIDPLCFEMEAAGLMNTFPCLIIRGICDYGDEHKNDQWQRYAAAVAAAYAKELLVNHVDRDEVQEMAKIGEILKDVQQTLSTVQSQITANALLSVLHAKLQVADGATYQRYNEKHPVICLEDTRTVLLQRISEWYGSPAQERIFWLCGKAGTGKSTIARTVASALSKVGILGATFFFRRGGGDCANAKLFVPTIVQQLVHRIPDALGRVADALNTDPFLCSESLIEQGEKLLVQPFAAVTGHRALFVVIDALDECESSDDIRTILELLPQVGANGFSLYTLVTSRPEHFVTRCFRAMQEDQYRRFNLEDMPAATTQHDIEKYLSHRFEVIRKESDGLPPDWPGSEAVKTLASLASPLWIFAATVCAYIAARQPQARLKALIANTGISLGSLNDMYGTILRQSLADEQGPQDQTLADFRNIVGSIVLLYAPLSTASLSSLLNADLEAITYTLRPLNSVLAIPASRDGPIELLHQSFRDFLLNPQMPPSDQMFHIDQAQTHSRLAEQCLRRLQQDQALKEDICNVKKPGAQRVEVDGQRVNAAIPADVAYACSYWASHAVQSGKTLRDNGEVHQFLRHYFIRWLEALSWLGRFYAATECIVQLRSLVDVVDSDELSAFLDDALRFTRTHGRLIDRTPLQLYTSALYFTPTNSVVRRTFPHKAYETFSLLPAVPLQWDEEVLRLKSSSSLDGLALSPDGELLVGWSSVGILQTWNASTGEEKPAVRVNAVDAETKVVAVAFSSDGSMLVLVLPNVIVQLRYPDQLERTLEGLEYDHHVARFSPDGELLVTATASRDTKHTIIRVWDTSTGAEKHNHRVDHNGGPTSIAIDASGNSLAIAWTNRIQLWDLLTGRVRWEFERDDPNSTIDTVAFSLDGTSLASNVGNRVQVWDVAIGSKKNEFDAGEWIRDLAVCPNHTEMVTLLIMGSMIQVRYVTGSQGEHLSQGHSALVTHTIFSPDGQLSASASYDRTLRLWDPRLGKELATMVHDDRVERIAFSPSGRLIASGSQDGTLRVWDTVTGEEKHKFESSNFVEDKLEFSADGKSLLTDVGDFELPTSDDLPDKPLDPVLASGLDYTIEDPEWLYYRGESIFWLPAGYRAALETSCAVFGNTLLLGSFGGAVSFFTKRGTGPDIEFVE